MGMEERKIRGFFSDFGMYSLVHREFSKSFVSSPSFKVIKNFTPGPRLMRIHLVQNSTSAKFEKSPKIST
jgi:hypothetical protein